MLPTRLELKNFKSHSHSVIDFNFSSALITGEKSGDPRRSNGSGKSGLLESISFALFSETGDKNSDDIVKHGQVSCEVTLDFTHDGESYQIKRIRNAKYSKVITEFWKTTNGDKQKLHGDTNKLTDAAICDVIKCNYDVFLNSVYFRQGSFFDFTQGTFSTRQALLGSLLNLEDWSKYQKLAKQKFDKLDGEITSLREQLLETESASAQLTSAEAELAQTTSIIDSSQSTIHQLESEISVLEDSVGNSSESVRKAAKLGDLKDELARKTRQLSQLREELTQIEKTIKEINISIDSVNLSKQARESAIKDLENAINTADLPSKMAELGKMEAALVDGKAKSRQIQTQISTLSGGDSCYTCGHVWHDSNAKLLEIQKKTQELEALTSKIARAESKTKSVKLEVDTVNSKSIELEKQRIGFKNLVEESGRLQLRKTSAESQRSAKLEEILTLESRSAALQQEISTISSAGGLEPDDRVMILSLKKQECKALSATLKDLFIKNGQLSAQIASLKLTISNREKALTKLNECTKQAVVYSRLTKAFGRDGVQAIIIDNVVDELTRATNQWLMEFSSEPMHVSFVTQRQGTKGEWKETFDIEINTRGGPRPWSSLSGGEKFLVSFAIRLALGSIRARRMGGETQLLLLDEVSSSLDPFNIDIFVSIIRKLERHMKVLVITHDPALKDQFDTVITVRRDEGGSVVA